MPQFSIEAEVREDGSFIIPFTVVSEDPLTVVFLYRSQEGDQDWGLKQIFPKEISGTESYDIFVCTIPNSRSQMVIPVKQEIRKVTPKEGNKIKLTLGNSISQPDFPTATQIVGPTAKEAFYDAEGKVQGSGFSLSPKSPAARVEEYLRENL
jgi:hypothetical protein